MDHGGKRVRALFLYAIGKAVILDDLSATDNDFRRGYPSTHKVYNESDAILIGYGLLATAFHIVSTAQRIDLFDRFKPLEPLSFSSGPSAFVYRQWLDLHQNYHSFEEHSQQHYRKTGAPFYFSLIAPTIITNKPNQINFLKRKKTIITFLEEEKEIDPIDSLYKKTIQSLQRIFEKYRFFPSVILIELVQKRNTLC